MNSISTAIPDRAVCPGDSVGAIIRQTINGQLYYLLLHRAWWPLGIAPGAGHVRDEHDDPLSAVRAEVHEELGLTVTGEHEVVRTWLPNLCQSPPARPAGHAWIVYTVTVTGTLTPSTSETKGASYLTPEELHAAARVTVEHARQGGHARDLPHGGLEGVWVELFARTGDLHGFSATDREAAARLYTTAPDEYWIS